MSKESQKFNRHRKQEFLMTFFSKTPYDTVEVNGFILEKHIDGITREWIVAIYTEESYKKKESFLKQQSLLNEESSPE